MYISAMLKSRGHQCDIFVEAFEKEDIVSKAVSEAPDIIGFSCLTSDYLWAFRKAEEIKKISDIRIVMGGTHVTLNPEKMIEKPYVDAICLGEGEYPMAELADALRNKTDITRIRNFWVKKNGGIVKNELRDLIQDLDSLPFPDRNLYSKYRAIQKKGKRPIHLGRGCPYECSYCHNATKKPLFKNKGKYVRWRSQESILKEIEELREKHFVKFLHFVDDSFGINREWLISFLSSLSHMRKKRLKLHANMRADMITEELCIAFKNYGARSLRLRIAVECGDEKMRQTILNKQVSNRSIIRAAQLFHKHKIKFVTYNMIGLPGETFSMALETLRFNVFIRPHLAICFIYQPYPGTQLANYAIDRGYLTSQSLQRLGTGAFGGFFTSTSILRNPDRQKIENLHHIFSIVAKFRILFPLAKSLAGSPKMTPLLQVLFKLHFYFQLFQRKFDNRL